jgi:hypothetical protein
MECLLHNSEHVFAKNVLNEADLVFLAIVRPLVDHVVYGNARELLVQVAT